MNTVRSAPLKDGKPVRQRADWPLLLGKAGMWLTVIAFGGLFWVINGGFSVIGLGVVAAAFNDAGRLFWATVTTIQFPVPVQVPGLPATQPLIPWIGVVAASLLQISVAWLKLSGRHIPPWLIITAGIVSAYDYGTTFFGLGTVAWLHQVIWPIRAILTAGLTFGLEAAIGFALRT